MSPATHWWRERPSPSVGSRATGQAAGQEPAAVAAISAGTWRAAVPMEREALPWAWPAPEPGTPVLISSWVPSGPEPGRRAGCWWPDWRTVLHGALPVKGWAPGGWSWGARSQGNTGRFTVFVAPCHSLAGCVWENRVAMFLRLLNYSPFT